jgi:hypothetical protein
MTAVKIAVAMALAFVAGVMWANRDIQQRFDYAARSGSNMALREMDGCASAHPDAIPACMHNIAETEHFDRIQ